MNNYFRNISSAKRILTIILAFTFLAGLFSVFLYPRRVSAQAEVLLPFGGRLINTDYATCSCGSVVLTIQDTKTQAPIRIVYIYALDLLKKFGVIPDSVPVPTVYEYYNIFTPGVRHLGRFIPTPAAPCLVIIPLPPFCAVVPSGSVGYLFDMGTSLIPTP